MLFGKKIKPPVIAIDMDNTIVDELGSTMRPGMESFLAKLQSEYSLILWTNSRRERAKFIILEFGLKKYFQRFIFREDYDPKDSGQKKDCTLAGAGFIIDDDASEIAFNQSKGVPGFKISAYRKSLKDKDYRGEYNGIYKLLF